MLFSQAISHFSHPRPTEQPEVLPMVTFPPKRSSTPSVSNIQDGDGDGCFSGAETGAQAGTSAQRAGDQAPTKKTVPVFLARACDCTSDGDDDDDGGCDSDDDDDSGGHCDECGSSCCSVNGCQDCLQDDDADDADSSDNGDDGDDSDGGDNVGETKSLVQNL